MWTLAYNDWFSGLTAYYIKSLRKKPHCEKKSYFTSNSLSVDLP